MSAKKKTVLWTVVALVIFGAVLTIVLKHRRQPITLRGAVLRDDIDPNKQSPIADVEITAINALGTGKAESASSGLFSITLPKGLRRRQPVILQFRHPEYQPLDVRDYIGDKLYVARMLPIRQETAAA